MKTISLLLGCSSFLLASEKPNILFLLIDDLGRQDIGIHGSRFHETPNLDRLAQEGLVFENAYAVYPRCVPSRYGIFSGRHPARDQVPGPAGEQLPLARVTFAERLQQAGYRTGYVGKWHLGKPGAFPVDQGFEWSALAGQAGAPPNYFWPFHESRKGQHRENEVFPVVEGTVGEYLTDRVAGEAISFLREEDERPFLLVMATYSVHTPFQAPEEVVQKYRSKLQQANEEPGGTSKDDPDFLASGQAVDKTRQNNPVYAAMVEKMDQAIGRVLHVLAESGEAANTLVVVTSDHGGLSTRGETSGRPLATSNLPFRHGKGWVYEGGLRVPHIVRWPTRVKAGTRTKVRTLGCDHYATFLQAVGLTAQPDLDGKSYLPVLRGGGEEIHSSLFFHSPAGRPHSTGDVDASAWIEGRWKLVMERASKRVELFDLEDDPGEKTNLAGQETEIRDRLLKKMKAHEQQWQVFERKEKNS